MRRKKVADRSAGALAAIVLLFGGLVVVKPAIDHWDSLYRADPFAVGTTTKRVVKQDAGRSAGTTTATERESAAERVLDNSGMLALRVILVALAAFLAAAVLQRVILGEYGLRISRTSASEVEAAPEPKPDEVPPATDDSAGEPAATQNGPTAPDISTSLAPPIARLIASRREELGLSQRELAKRAGISHTVVSRIEQGEQTPSRKTLEQLADALRTLG